MREVSDAVALEITLVENIQREDLNPIEEARAFDRLATEFNFTQEEVAARTGKDRAVIGNALRLLRLERPILDLIEDGRVTAGHSAGAVGLHRSGVSRTGCRAPGCARGPDCAANRATGLARRARREAATGAAHEPAPLDPEHAGGARRTAILSRN